MLGPAIIGEGARSGRQAAEEYLQPYAIFLGFFHPHCGAIDVLPELVLSGGVGAVYDSKNIFGPQNWLQRFPQVDRVDPLETYDGFRSPRYPNHAVLLLLEGTCQVTGDEPAGSGDQNARHSAPTIWLATQLAMRIAFAIIVKD